MNNCENCKYSTSRICNQCMNHLTCSHGKADLCKKCAEKCIEQSKDINYEQDHSHIHCWNQGTSTACGQPLEKHTQCCLCDETFTFINKKDKILDESGRFFRNRRDNETVIMTNMPTKNTMEERYDKEFYIINKQIGILVSAKIEPSYFISEKIKSFIRQELSLQAKEIGEEIERMEKKRIKNFDTSYEVENANGYNQALDEILSILKKYYE